VCLLNLVHQTTSQMFGVPIFCYISLQLRLRRPRCWRVSVLLIYHPFPTTPSLSAALTLYVLAAHYVLFNLRPFDFEGFFLSVDHVWRVRHAMT